MNAPAGDQEQNKEPHEQEQASAAAAAAAIVSEPHTSSKSNAKQPADAQIPEINSQQREIDKLVVEQPNPAKNLRSNSPYGSDLSNDFDFSPETMSTPFGAHRPQTIVSNDLGKPAWALTPSAASHSERPVILQPIMSTTPCRSNSNGQQEKTAIHRPQVKTPSRIPTTKSSVPRYTPTVPKIEVVSTAPPPANSNHNKVATNHAPPSNITINVNYQPPFKESTVENTITSMQNQQKPTDANGHLVNCNVVENKPVLRSLPINSANADILTDDEDLCELQQSSPLKPIENQPTSPVSHKPNKTDANNQSLRRKLFTTKTRSAIDVSNVIVSPKRNSSLLSANRRCNSEQETSSKSPSFNGNKKSMIESLRSSQRRIKNFYETHTISTHSVLSENASGNSIKPNNNNTFDVVKSSNAVRGQSVQATAEMNLQQATVSKPSMSEPEPNGNVTNDDSASNTPSLPSEAILDSIDVHVSARLIADIAATGGDDDSNNDDVGSQSITKADHSNTAVKENPGCTGDLLTFYILASMSLAQL